MLSKLESVNQTLFRYHLDQAREARRLAHACARIEETTAEINLWLRAQKEMRAARRYYNRAKESAI